MSINQNFPEVSPSLTLDFANSRRLDPRITFTRSSTATYVSSNGLIKTAPVDEARFDHDPETLESLGLLIEESRINVSRFSEDFSNTTYWTPTSQTVLSNATLSPDETVTADNVIPAAGTNSVRYLYYNANPYTMSVSTVYTSSIFVKKNGLRYFAFQVHDNSFGSGHRAGFDLDNGIVVASTVNNMGSGTGATASIVSYPNGWYRCIITGTTAPTGTSGRTAFSFTSSLDANASVSAITADGISGGYVWGMQVEAGSFPTSYIPTAGSSATRAQDNVSISGASFNNFYNQTEGTIVSRFKGGRRFIAPSTTENWSRVVGFGPTNRALLSSGNSGNNNIHIYNGIQTHNITLGPDHINGFTTAAVGFGSNSATLADAGYVAETIAGGWPTPTVDQFVLGNDGTGLYPLNGYIDKIHYYPKRLTNAQLQNLTK